MNMKYPNIEAERVRRGMTLDAMSQALGVTRKTVYNWYVHGRIPQRSLEKMSDLFDCPVDYLLGRIDRKYDSDVIKQGGTP